MFGFKKYNYDRFSRDLIMRDFAASKMGGGVEAGERAPDFEARTLDGDKVQLSDFEGEKNVVLTFGSATCPMTAASIEGMNDLYDEYNGDDVQFLFVYVREAHPGEELPAHQSMDDKIRAAEVLRDEDDVEMPIVVDDLRGSIHKKYSKLPNATFIIDKSGRVAFRCLWTDPDIVEEALEELAERQEERGVDHVIVRGGEHTAMRKIAPFLHAHRALERGGRESIENFNDTMGAPGRVAVTAGRMVRPVAENPGKILVGAALAAGVITAGVLAGKKLREKRLHRNLPYDIHEAVVHGRRTGTGTDDYEPVGI
jgi:peroxiredoxin